MRTTVDLPDDLFRRIKAEAALRGQSLRELITEALLHVLESGRKMPANNDFLHEWELTSKAVSKKWKNEPDAVKAVREIRR